MQKSHTCSYISKLCMRFLVNWLRGRFLAFEIFLLSTKLFLAQQYFSLQNCYPRLVRVRLHFVLAVCVDILVSPVCVSISSWLGAWVSRPRQPSRARCPKTAEKRKHQFSNSQILDKKTSTITVQMFFGALFEKIHVN